MRLPSDSDSTGGVERSRPPRLTCTTAARRQTGLRQANVRFHAKPSLRGAAHGQPTKDTSRRTDRRRADVQHAIVRLPLGTTWTLLMGDGEAGGCDSPGAAITGSIEGVLLTYCASEIAAQVLLWADT